MMGDRICIRITTGEETTPMFYGHWCGLRGLKVMNEALRAENNGLANLICNFIVMVMDGKRDPYNYYLYNDDGDYSAADGDWWCWTYHMHIHKWTTTHPAWKGRQMTKEEVDNLVRSIRPCLFRTCPCDHYGEPDPEHPERTKCEKAFWDKIKKTPEKDIADS